MYVAKCEVRRAVTRWWVLNSSSFWISLVDCGATSPASPDCCFAFFIIRSAQACLAFLIEVFYTSGWHHHSIQTQWSFPKGQQLNPVPPPSRLLPRDGGAQSSVWQSHTPLSFVPSLLPHLCKPWQQAAALGASYTKVPPMTDDSCVAIYQWRQILSMNYWAPACSRIFWYETPHE